MRIEIPDLNYTSFNDYLKSRVVLVDFWAEWCHPCNSQHKMLEEMAFEYDHLFKTAKVNVDENKVISTKLGVSNIPTLILFRDGVELRRIIGLQSKDILSSQIKNALSSNKINENVE